MQAPQRIRGRQSSVMTVNFGDGERSIADLIAPGSFEERRDRVEVDGRASRILVLSDYPRSVTPNWLAPLLDGEYPIDFSLHIQPVPSDIAARALDLKLVRFESSRRLRARAGRLASSEAEIAYDDTERLRIALERGDQRVFQASAYMRVYGQTPTLLDEAARHAELALGAQLAAARPALFEMLPGLLSCLPAGQDYLRRLRNMDTSSLATLMPFASSQAGDREGILVGLQRPGGGPVILDLFGRENANSVVFAQSGAGKSYANKLDALRALLAGIHYTVIDPENEYEPLARAVDGQIVRVSGASSQHINPFDLPRRRTAPEPEADRAAGDEDLDPLAAQVLSVQGLLALMLEDDGRPPGQRERGVLDRAIYRAYAAAGIERDPGTHDREPPVLSDLIALLEEDGDPQGLATSLQRYAGGSLGSMFSERTTISLDSPFVVFDTQHLEEELRPLATYLIAQHIWREVRGELRRRLLLIDEAWTLLRYPAGAAFIERMARQARKHGLGLIVISQDVSDFLASAAGEVVLANSARKLLMRQDSSVIDLVASTFRLSRLESDFLVSCPRGSGLLILGSEHVPVEILASEFEHSLISTDPQERMQ